MSKDQIKREYLTGEIDRMSAIEALQEIGLSGREAELLVDEWYGE